jgi:hypothetical protein
VTGAECKSTLASSWFDSDGGEAAVYATLGSTAVTSNVEVLEIAATPAGDGELSAVGMVAALPSFATVAGGLVDVQLIAHTGTGTAQFALGVWVAQVDWSGSFSLVANSVVSDLYVRWPGGGRMWNTEYVNGVVVCGLMVCRMQNALSAPCRDAHW